jgi:predicted PurR-regulated permease PerM
LIPVVGGALMWVPFAAYEYSFGNTDGALFIAIYSVVMISIIADTFIKPIIIREINIRYIKSNLQLNEMVIFFAILAGLATFGFWGMILGPAITSFFMALLKLVEAKSTEN